jgi:hypothetical protein
MEWRSGAFLHGIGFLRFGMSCYPTTLLFKQTSILCTFPESKANPPPPTSEFWIIAGIPESISLQKWH